MSTVPSWLLRHTVQVEEYLGSGAYGDQYGAPETVRCLVVDNPKMVRNGQGEEVMSSSSYIAKPTHRPAENSRVTMPLTGQRRTIVAVKIVTAPGLPTPDNTEVFLN